MQKIILTGPESTGKSTLAKLLASDLNAILVPEYARTYLNENGLNYNQQDLLKIAKGQNRKEKEAESLTENYIVCDTSFLVLKIWSEFKYGFCDPEILQMLQKNHQATYLLCGIDVPWEYDPQRENPRDRTKLYQIFKSNLSNLAYEHIELVGTLEERLIAVLKYLKSRHTDVHL